MNKVERSSTPDGQTEAPRSPADGEPGRAAPVAKPRTGRVVFLVAAPLLLIGGLAIGFWQHYKLNAEVATAEQNRSFVPSVRTAPVRASGSTMSVQWPGTTEAFEQANIYARASGYISKRNVDIGSLVKAGDLLVEITAQELDHQIAQAEGTLAQMEANLDQAKANRDLAQVTWDRDNPLVQKGWVTSQQGDTDRLNFRALDAAVSVAQANIVAQKAQLQVLRQQKAYQSMVAPFDGVITQRNVDIGTLVQADVTSGTFLFTLMHSDTLRIQLYVPQDEAFEVAPGVDAVVLVPEMPAREFPGKVTRIGDALQPGTRTLLTEIDLPNPDHALSPGIFCTVELKIPRKTPSLMVPSEAIVFNRDGLNVVEDGVAHIRHVNVVRDFGTTVEVNSGVKDGDQVIFNPPVDLTDGHKVNIKPAPPAQLS